MLTSFRVPSDDNAKVAAAIHIPFFYILKLFLELNQKAHLINIKVQYAVPARHIK